MKRQERDSIRTFICIEIPATIRDRIGKLQDDLRQAGGQLSWVKPSNIHLTLKFLGDVATARIPRVCAAVERSVAAINPFELEVGGAGCFPSPRSPRVLWVGLTSIPPTLIQAQASIETELSEAGFERESKRFSPHLTIGRFRSPQNGPLVAGRLLSTGFEPERFLVKEIIVMRSDLNPLGSVYTPQSTIRLV